MNALMIQGTASSVGKSFLTAGLCRLYARRGISVAPFKSQNMSNQAAVDADGGELGRAQAVQAAAAGVDPHVDMNPILLKPEGELRSQVILQGRPLGSMTFRNYQSRRTELVAAIRASFSRLQKSHELIVIEGAGSPAEINLRDRDLVNMWMAREANAQVLLVGTKGERVGAVQGAVFGTMTHGLLAQPELRSAICNGLATRRGQTRRPTTAADPAARFDRLADHLEAHLDIAQLDRVIGR